MTKLIRTVSVLTYLLFIGAVWIALPVELADKSVYTLFATIALGASLYLAEIFNQPKGNKGVPPRPKSPNPILDVSCSTDVRARTHRRRRHESSLGNLGMLDEEEDWPLVRQSPSVHGINDPDATRFGSDSSSSSSSPFSSSSYDSGSCSSGSSSGGGCD